jgi:hypothetical protein
MENIELSECTYEHIKDTFYYGLFGDFKLVIDKATGCFNATKLCVNGGKKWSRLEKSKKMVEYYIESRGLDLALCYEIKGDNKDLKTQLTTGTYVPKELILDIASWVSIEFYDQVKHIINMIDINDIDSKKDEFMDMFTFIKNKNVGIDVSSDWFQELWYPLSKKRHILGSMPQNQGSLEQKRGRTGPTPLQYVFVRTPLLDWLGYGGEYKLQKQGWKRLLDNNNIPYEEIDHTDQRFLEHPSMKRELQNVNEGNLVQKRWIVMDTRNFKKAVMRLNTKHSDMIRDYYLNLEEACFEYAEYQANWLVKKAEKERDKSKSLLAIKDQQLNQEKEQRLKAEQESKEKLQRALKFNQATKQVEPQEYIYIATTEQYMLETKFKPGGCGTFDLVKSRLSQYNSGKSDSNAHFYVYIRKVVSYRSIEQALLGCLGGFRENANKELYIINYNWLVKCVDAIIDHNDEFLLFVNLHRDQMVEDTMNNEPIIVPPLRLEKIRISYQRIGEEEVDLTTIFNQDTIDAIKESLTSFSPDNNTIKRTAFENHLKQQYPEVKIDNKKRPLWEIVKQIGGSINPKWRYKY